MRAGLLAEVSLRRRVGPQYSDESLPPAVKALRDLPVFRRIDYAKASLASRPDAADAIMVGDALVCHIATFRDSDLRSFQDRKEFIEHARKAWPVLQRLALLRINDAQLAGKEEVAKDLERKLLLWAEQFENRILLEELRLTGERAGDDGAELGETWEQGAWGLSEPWGEQDLLEWSEHAIEQWLHERRKRIEDQQNENDSPLVSSCLGTVESAFASAEGAELTVTTTRKPIAIENRVELQSLEELVPPQCIWIRTLFDEEDRLLWWAWANNDGNLKRLASGTSSPGARERLEAANVEFDRLTDLAWHSFRKYQLQSRGASLPAFQHLNDAMRDPQRFATVVLPNDRHRQLFHDGLAGQLRELAKEWPTLALSGQILLEWLMAYSPEPKPFPDEAWEQWNANLQIRHRIELNTASSQHLAALVAEWDLSNLWVQDQLPINWEDADILFQVQGALLAMPLAWLPFGGRPLYQQVASTGEVISLTLRHDSYRRVGDQVKPNPLALSAQWEEPRNRLHAHGLPLLHAGIRRLAEDYGCKARSLGDDPQASMSNLCIALREKFGLVVVGAHGDNTHAGVKLRDEEPWCGDDADLNDVDLLILCSCAVGRLTQRGHRDVEGMYARLAVHGARCVVAARWPIADLEAAVLLGEFLNEYFKVQRGKGVVQLFDRARAFNRARRNLLEQRCPLLGISLHLAAAFEMYGLG